MEHYLGVARERGIASEEIGAVQAMAMAVCAGKVNAMMKAAQKNPGPEAG